LQGRRQDFERGDVFSKIPDSNIFPQNESSVSAEGTVVDVNTGRYNTGLNLWMNYGQTTIPLKLWGTRLQHVHLDE
jgi:hypothetical protein